MTCREKLKLERPGNYEDLLNTTCPDAYQYADTPDCSFCEFGRCKECWDREVDAGDPGEEAESVTATALIDEICEARKKFIDAGFSANEAFNLVWDIFKGRWNNERQS